MKNILVCNQKGGVGKSLIADELAFSFERAGVPINFYDLDVQGGTIHKTVENKGAEISVVDTPGALQKELRNWISEADLIIIPTRATSRDIEPLQRMQRAVQDAAKRGTPVLYVINGFNRFRAASDFKEYLSANISKDQLLTLPQSEQFVQASAGGMSVVEYAKLSSAARDMRILCNRVHELVGIEKEQ